MKKVRNAITEARDLGHTIGEIAYECGISKAQVKAYLKAAKAGYNSPHEQEEALVQDALNREAREHVKAMRKAGL